VASFLQVPIVIFMLSKLFVACCSKGGFKWVTDHNLSVGDIESSDTVRVSPDRAEMCTIIYVDFLVWRHTFSIRGGTFSEVSPRCIAKVNNIVFE